MYKVGQKVRVKSWEQMEKEYGLNSCGSIKTPSSFTREMNWFCGMIFTIKNVRSGIFRVTYDLETITGDEDENRELLYFCWDEVMLIPIAGKLETMIKERRKNV